MILDMFDLNNKLIQPDRVAELAIDDEKLLADLLDGVSAGRQKSAVRETCSKALMHMAEVWPEMLFPHWDYFMDLLASDNGFSKYVAVYVLSSLAVVEPDGRFEKSLDDFYRALDDESVMIASHLALVSGKIARAKPKLRSEITRRLFKIDQSHFDEGHQSLVKAYIIEAFERYFDVSENKNEIMAFVEQQKDCSSPKTRKLAKAFLEKWAITV
jgi:hypothetical protein